MQPTNATGQYDENAMPRVEKSPQVGAPRAEISRTPYQQYVYKNTPDGHHTRTIDFDVVPANSRLEITNVSCHLEIQDLNRPAILLLAQLLVIRPNGTIASASTFAPTLLFKGPPHTWAANHAVYVFADAGQHFQAYLRKPPDMGFWHVDACHISGHLVRLQ